MPISLPTFCAALALVVTPATVAFAAAPVAEDSPLTASGVGSSGKTPARTGVLPPSAGKVLEPGATATEEVEGALEAIPGVGDDPVDLPNLPQTPELQVPDVPQVAVPGTSQPAPEADQQPQQSVVRAPARRSSGSSSTSRPAAGKTSNVKNDSGANGSSLTSDGTTQGSGSSEKSASDSGGPVADLVKSVPVAARELKSDTPSPITRIIEMVPGRYRIAIAVLAALCLMLAGVLIRERMRSSRAEHDAMTDPLTGLMNRRAFDAALAEEWNRAERYDRPMSLLFLDVDQFKQFNDSKGHLAGDELLRDLATKLRGQLRSFDVAARLGGDEFVVLCPETDEDGAKQAARRLDRVLQELPVQVSVGRASRRQADRELSELMTRADRQMYKAKALASAR